MSDGFVALKRAAEDREGWRHRERMSYTCCTAEDRVHTEYVRWFSMTFKDLVVLAVR